jgi:hypothetical protein
MQGLRYNLPEDRRYKGDMAMRVNTRRKKAPLKEGEKRAVGQPKGRTSCTVVTTMEELLQRQSRYP